MVNRREFEEAFSQLNAVAGNADAQQKIEAKIEDMIKAVSGKINVLLSHLDNPLRQQIVSAGHQSFKGVVGARAQPMLNITPGTTLNRKYQLLTEGITFLEDFAVKANQNEMHAKIIQIVREPIAQLQADLQRASQPTASPAAPAAPTQPHKTQEKSPVKDQKGTTTATTKLGKAKEKVAEQMSQISGKVSQGLQWVESTRLWQWLFPTHPEQLHEAESKLHATNAWLEERKKKEEATSKIWTVRDEYAAARINRSVAPRILRKFNVDDPSTSYFGNFGKRIFDIIFGPSQAGHSAHGGQAAGGAHSEHAPSSGAPPPGESPTHATQPAKENPQHRETQKNPDRTEAKPTQEHPEHNQGLRIHRPAA